VKKLLTFCLLIPIYLFSFNYNTQWNIIENFDKQHLPKSALEKVELIYEQAKIENNSVQFIHATLYKKNYAITLKENGKVEAIKVIEMAIKESKTTEEIAILNSILAELYTHYLQENYYRIHRRTEIKNSQNSDILTWSSRDFLDKIYELYQKSLSDNTKDTKLSNYKEILSSSKNTNELRPTLYDFLLFRALEYFQNENSYIHQRRGSFIFKNRIAFSDALTFASLHFSTKDRTLFKYQTTLLYQKLINYYAKNHYYKALDYVNLQRLQFVKRNYRGANAKKYYLEALETTLVNNPNSEALSYLMEYYMQKSNYKKALLLTKQALMSQNKFVQQKAKKVENEIKQQILNITIEEVSLPHQNILAKIDYRNIEHLYSKIFKLNEKELKRFKNCRTQDKQYEYLNTLQPLKYLDSNLPKTKDYKQHSTELSLSNFNLGHYVFLFSPNKIFKKKHLFKELSISNLSYLERRDKLIVLNRKTGDPIENVKVILENSQKNEQLTRVSNSDGYVKLPNNKDSYKITLKYKDDILKLNNYYVNQNYEYEHRDYSSRRVYFFTDRSLYRPNQLIYFKGLATRNYSKKPAKILKYEKITVTFKNTNNQEVAQTTFTTDEFGTFHGTFIAPSSGLLGSMSIVSNIGGRANIQVEEYKRPKFEVTFEPNNKQYSIGDKITIKGLAKAYAGNAIDGAKVKYRVERSTSYNWFNYDFMPYNNYTTQLKSGEIKSNEKGEFNIEFIAKEQEGIMADSYPNYDYTIYADVTDSTGERHSSATTLHLGRVNFVMNMRLKKEQDVEKNSTLTLESSNLNGQFIPLQGSIEIRRIEAEKKLYVKRYWQQGDKKSYTKEEFEKLFPNYRYDERKKENKSEFVETVSFNTANAKSISLNHLAQGKYILKLKVNGYGDELVQTKEFTRFNLNTKELISPKYLWQKYDKREYKTDEKVLLNIKSSKAHTKVLLTLNQYNKTIKEKWIEINNFTQEVIELKKAYQGNIDYQLTLVADNRVFYEKGYILIPWDNKLNVEFLSFRDKLKPNEKEQFKIKISGKNREKVLAQMVATIYDASLDALYPHNYYSTNFYPTSPSSYKRWSAKGFNSSNSYGRWREAGEANLRRVFPSLKWLNSYDRRENRVTYESASMVMASPAPIYEESEMGGDIVPVEPMIMAYPADDMKKYKEKNENKTPISIRKNLQETMLFKPDLQTDEEGNIVINFKTNEALTRWNFMAFTHTKDLKTTVTKKSFTTAKELMVVTNLPRFFREKDLITLSAKVVNMSDKDLSGTCELKLVDPTTEKPIFNQEFKKEIFVKKGASTVVEFEFKVPDVDRVSAIKHTIIAKTATHTDAEQIIRPILSNRVFVTESKNMFVKAHESKSFTLESLKNANSTTLSNHKLTLEFTSNPAWYAIKSLPYLMEYPHECNEQLFNRYFANALAAKIANSSPKIKEVFEKWKSKSELISALESNKELKSVLLEETPWVLNAKSEAEQQANLGILFDLVRLAKEEKATYNKLIKRQFEHSDGGWAWFESPHSNWYITQYIVEGFGKLKKLGIDKTNTEAMGVATHYMDMKMLEQYKELLKNVEVYGAKLEDDHLNSMLIHYLYARSFYKFKMSSEVQEAHNYYLREAMKYWGKKGLYEQGMIALTLNARAEKESALAIVKSLKERALVSNELGMYFKYNNGFYWNQMPIETHALMMDVFETVAKDKESVELLKTWLLKNKQTTHWKTTKATASAIYALLSDGEWLKNDKNVELSFETTLPYKEELEKAEIQTGTGYIKASYKEFDQSMATVKVNNPNNGLAWGALYWQYFEDMDKVKNFKETPLTLSKELFLIEQTAQGELLSPISNQALNVGDRVKVRIELRVDRDMEYIMLKDARASAFEPLNVLSQYKYQDGLGYYESTKDNATYFFIDYLRKGTYVFEYPLVVTHKGDFSNGITTIESMYAPEFKSHSKGVRVRIK